MFDSEDTLCMCQCVCDKDVYMKKIHICENSPLYFRERKLHQEH